MRKELQDRLFKKYPKIFKQKDMTMQETAMCWGIACGDGWYDLIDELCGEIQNRVKNINRSRQHKIKNSPKTLIPVCVEKFICEAVQVKEKWGSLRFYIYGGDDFIQGSISLAESLSHKLCAQCGLKKEKTDTNRSLCLNCQDKFLTRRKNENR